MSLHFRLRDIFLYTLLLGIGEILCGHVLFFAVALMGGFAVVLCRKDVKNSLPDLIFALAMLMNVWYVLSSWGNVRQHDYYNFVMHADYFVRHDFFLKDPVSYIYNVYFQPPLWGFVAGLFTEFLSFDYVRFLNLFAIGGVGIIFWRLMRELFFKENVRIWLFALFMMFPIHGIFANLVNNDPMIYFLMMLIMLHALRWYKNGEWSDVIIMAGALLCAGLIKYSGLMIVPAIGVLGLCRLFANKEVSVCKFWVQCGVIGLGALLGFSWGLFLLYHNFPLVPPPQNVEWQSLEDYSLWDRLLAFETINEPFVDISIRQLEPNIFLTLLKTSLFGEWSWSGGMWAYVMYVIGAVMAIVWVLSFASLWKYKLGGEFCFNLFVVVLTFSVIISHVSFWLSYPYFCSMEFRYVIILLPLSLLWLGNYLSQKSLPKYINYTLAGGLVLFMVAKFMLYLNTI